MTGEELKAWRQRHELTQEQAANALGASLGAVRHYEQGLRPIPSTVEKLTAYIDRCGLEGPA